MKSKFVVTVLLVGFVVTMIIMGAGSVGLAQTVIKTIGVGNEPFGVGVNPSTNKVYVSNFKDGTVSVIEGSTDTVSKTVGVGNNPWSVDANPTTNKIYVSNCDDNTVSVIDGSTDTVSSTIRVGDRPYGVGVNPTTNKIYVANYYGDTVSVIDGSTDTVSTTVPVGTWPSGVGVNPTTNKIYVANSKDGTVSVIDGSTDTVSSTVNVGKDPEGVAVNPTTNKIYVADYGDNTVSVIDGSTDTVSTTVVVGNSSYCVGVNPTTNKIYSASSTDDTVSVIDGSTDTVSTTVGVGDMPFGVGANPTTNKIYVSNYAAGTVSVIDDSPSPNIHSCSPEEVVQGHEIPSFHVKGEYTNFTQGTSNLAISGDGITIGATTVKDATHLSADIKVAGNATPGARDINVITGTETPTPLAGGLTVHAAPASAPELNHVYPPQGMVGSYATLMGKNFGKAQGSSTVDFNGTTATGVVFWSDDMIVVSVPLGATSGPVKVITPWGTSNAIDYTIENFTLYFAEGTTRPGFEPYICILNPDPATADVTITYMLGDGNTKEQKTVCTLKHKENGERERGCAGRGRRCRT